MDDELFDLVFAWSLLSTYLLTYCNFGGGWERVRRDCRVGGSLEAAAQSKR